MNDLLDVAKFETGTFKVDRKPTDVAKLIEKLIGILKPVADQKSQRIIFSSQFVAPRYVDPDLFNKALQSLLENAINYAPENTQIAIKLFCEEKICAVSTHNEGSVIAEEDKPRLFEKFSRRTDDFFG